MLLMSFQEITRKLAQSIGMLKKGLKISKKKFRE
jgi:hypothetical protein